MLKRKIAKTIEIYCQSNKDKILCIDGARQIGKSFIIREMCKKYFTNYIELNMADDYNGDRLFEKVRTTEAFYLQVSVKFGDIMNNNKDTIIFIDEIQIYPHLLTLLKPLKSENKYRYICSGSELGIALAKTTLIPMGSIEEIEMYPMDFEEFLWANNVGKLTINHLKKCFKDKKNLEESLHQKILTLFKMYLYVGGMPEAVQSFVNDKNVALVNKIHSDIVKYYREDASKYDKTHKLKIKKIFDMLPSNLSNKVKRIEYKRIEGIDDVRYKRYENEFDYLISSGIALDAKAVSEPKFPLVQSSSKNLIKLYMNDVGLLSHLLYKNNINAILNDKKGINLGAVYETAVAQELKCHGHNLYYYDRRKVGEVDYLIDDYDNLSTLPIEIKSGMDETNFRALPKIVNSREYKIVNGFVLSNKREISVEGKIIYLPIYFIMFL